MLISAWAHVFHFCQGLHTSPNHQRVVGLAKHQNNCSTLRCQSSHHLPPLYASLKMPMTNATRISLRHNAISNLTMIIWGTLASGVSNTCTPKNANFLSLMGYIHQPNLALWQKIPSKSPVNCPSAQLVLLHGCASSRTVPNTLNLMPNWKTFSVRAISSRALLFPWISTSLQSMVNFL